MGDETRGDEPLGGETTRPHESRSGEMHGDEAQGRQRHHDGASSSGERGEEAAALLEAAGAALEYLRVVPDRRVFPTEQALTALSAFDEPLPDRPGDPTQTVRFLHELGSPATVASNGPSYFGFVTGGAHPAALAAAWLASTWDQNAALPVMSPVAARLHAAVQGWVVELLGLPSETELALVTGATIANASAFAVARDSLLARHGWDVQARGLIGAPELAVVVGEHAHATVRKALGLVGLGRDRVHVVPADDQGRMRAEHLPDLAGPVLVVAQAGEVSTGAFDPFDEIADWAAGRDAWLHVDGAFGLWAAVDPSRSALVRGLERADSWATDAHKWLNVTYDSGLVLVREPGTLRRSFFATADYLPPDPGGRVEPGHMTPQTSQRARVVEVWAVLRTLGREGLVHLVGEACAHARLVAGELTAGGLRVLNDVVLNQVLVAGRDAASTRALLAAVHDDGRIWCGPTTWHGEPALRFSVSSWRTTRVDAERAARVLLELARQVDAIG